MAKREEATSRLPELKKDIKEKHTKRLYVFHGEETFLLHHYLQQLKKLLLDPVTESFNFHKLTSEHFDVQSFADGVESLPMMAEHSLVLIDDVDLFKLTEEEKTIFARVISDIPEYCTVVLQFETVEWKPDKRSKFWSALLENAFVVEFSKQENRDLVPWIGRHFAAEKKRISTDLCVYLIELTGGTMTALAGEIKKICAYSGADTIVRSDIDAVVEPVLDAVIYQMTDCLGEGDYGGALQKMQQLLMMQNDPLLILGSLSSHFRRMSAAKTLLENGKTADDLMRLYGMRDYPARKMMASTKRFSMEVCAKAAELIMETDRQIKTSYASKDEALKLLILQIAMEAKNG